MWWKQIYNTIRPHQTLDYLTPLKSGKKNVILAPTNRWWRSKLICNAGVLQAGDRTRVLRTAYGRDGITVSAMPG